MSASADGTRYVGATARVDLLPREVREQVATRRTRRSMLLLIVLAIVVVLAGFGAVQLLGVSSANDLAAANAQTQSLIAKQAEYQRVRALQSANQQADALHRVTTATQLDWESLLSEALAPLPPSVAVGNVTIDSQSPLDTPDQSKSPFGQAAIGSIVLELSSARIDDLTAWLARMRADRTFSSVTALQAQNQGAWRLTATLYISPSVTALKPPPTPTPAATDGGHG